jgi:PAS domain S-box-containing protein
MDEDEMSVNDLDPDDIDELRARLAEAEETLRAIRHGEVDALLVTDGTGERVYTLRSADAPYRALVEQMQEGAVTVNTDGGIMYANRRFAELVDAPLQRVIGASIDQFVDPLDRELVEGAIREGVGNLRTRLRNPGKPMTEAHISVSSVLVDGMEHRTLIVTDMSTLTRVQRESRSKDEFLAMLAHELRNPLGAIGGAVQVLGLADLSEPRATRARDVIERQTMHMARLVDDLLDVGRVVTGKIALNVQPVDLAESVRSYVATRTSAHTLDERIVATTEPVWVLADPVRLEQIIGNLVSNALRFTAGKQPVRLAVGAEGVDAVLQVTDVGTGIDPDLLPNIFDLFVQGPSSVDRTKGGLGIGLTLVRRLVELHGGVVAAYSPGKDQGSTFTVRLPAIQPAAAFSSNASTSVGGHGVRVLLVDDNADSREMYSFVLRDEGHDVYEAEDADAALAIFHRVALDVAVVDIGLPGMDGYELARRVRATPHGAKVTLIALTGYGRPEDRERSRSAGFDRHLVKPAAPDELRRELNQLRPQSLESRNHSLPLGGKP